MGTPSIWVSRVSVRLMAVRKQANGFGCQFRPVVTEELFRGAMPAEDHGCTNDHRIIGSQAINLTNRFQFGLNLFMASVVFTSSATSGSRAVDVGGVSDQDFFHLDAHFYKFLFVDQPRATSRNIMTAKPRAAPRVARSVSCCCAAPRGSIPRPRHRSWPRPRRRARKAAAARDEDRGGARHGGHRLDHPRQLAVPEALQPGHALAPQGHRRRQRLRGSSGGRCRSRGRRRR